MKIKNYYVLLLLAVAVLNTFSVSAQYISRFAGTGYGSGTPTGGFSGDGGQALDARLNGCTSVAVDGAGNVYIADKGNNVVRKINSAGVITTFAGTGAAGNSGDGGPAVLAKLNAPSAVTTDATGNVYISDNGNSTVRIVTTTGIINNYAGNGTAGSAGNGGAAGLAQLNDPGGLAMDAAGNLYIADAGNNMIRKVAASTHTISTVAGNGSAGYSGDGGAAAAAKLYNPCSVAVNAAGELYIADILNNVVRKVSGGMITTFAGTGTPGNSGDGGAAVSATMRYPSGVSVDISGDVYIADQGNNNIRKVSAGVISHVAGSSTGGFSGDGGFAVVAKLSAPKGVTADGAGRIFIADYGNHVVRVVSSSASASQVQGDKHFSIYPNPSNGQFTISMPALQTSAMVTVTDMMGRIAATTAINPATQNQPLNFSTLAAGTYTVRVNAASQQYSGRIVIQH